MASYGDRRPPPVRPGVEVVGTLYRVRLPFWPELADELKVIGGRWDRTERCWWIPGYQATTLDGILREYGLALPDRVSAPPPPRSNGHGGDPYQGLFRSLPTHLRQPAFRALAKALHPDVGGDTAAMQQLTRAFNEVCR